MWGQSQLIKLGKAEHDLVDQAEYDVAVGDVLEFVAQRYDFLSATELLGE